ncbi:MAG: hypothetical protein OEL54_03525 [Flavobacteriaceae bacterium]|nr:hypothetical protein [Flavobacteriaceae bacterium]
MSVQKVLESQVRDTKNLNAKYISDPNKIVEAKTRRPYVSRPFNALDRKPVLFSPYNITQYNTFDGKVNSSTTPTFGNLITFKLQKNILDYCILASPLVTGTNTYANYTGMAIIERYRLLQGSDEIFNWKYEDILYPIMKNLDAQELAQFVAIFGPVSGVAAAGTIYSLIAFPWSSWYDKDRVGTPIDLSACEELTLEITFRAGANVVDTAVDTHAFSGPCQLISKTLSVEPSQREKIGSFIKFKGPDFNTSKETAIASTSGDISLIPLKGGRINRIYVYDRLAASIAANSSIYFINLDTATASLLTIDNDNFEKIASNKEYKIHKVMNNTKQLTTLGSPLVYEFAGLEYRGNILGFLNGVKLTDLNLNFTTAGTNSVHAVVEYNADYEVVDGLMKKQR